MDILLKRSLDNGATWGEPRLVYGNSTDGPHKEWHTIGDALPVYDTRLDAVHLVFTRDNHDVLYSRSDDAGLSWRAPTNLTAATGLGGDFCGTGHAGGLQTSSGRILLPMYGCGVGHPFVLASDDHGANWRNLGRVDADPNEWDMAPTTPFQRPRGGAGAVATPELLASVRSADGLRLEARSVDGGATWSKPTRMRTLPEPITGCEGALILHPNGKMYYSHPDAPVLRNKMVVKVSTDAGVTWRDHKEIWGPHSGCSEDAGCVPAASYSSMAVLGNAADSSIGLVYMRNNKTMLVFEGSPSYTTFAP